MLLAFHEMPDYTISFLSMHRYEVNTRFGKTADLVP